MAKLPVVDSLKAHVSRLIDENVSLKGERNSLNDRCVKLQSENRELQMKTAELERRIQVLELGESLSGGDDKRKAKLQINRLMREVDKCIALMNK